MATASILGADPAVLADSPVQRLLLASNLSGHALRMGEQMLQELRALAGCDARRRRQRREHRRATGYRGLR